MEYLDPTGHYVEHGEEKEEDEHKGGCCGTICGGLGPLMIEVRQSGFEAVPIFNGAEGGVE